MPEAKITRMPEAKKKEEKKVGLPLKHKNFPAESIETKIMNRVFSKRGWDALLTFQGENGAWNLTRQSNYVNSKGVRERSFGLCQLMEQYHAPFIWADGYREARPGYFVVDRKKAEAAGFTDKFLDWEQHVDYCLEVWDRAMAKKKIATTFYAYNTRERYRNLFTVEQ